MSTPFQNRLVGTIIVAAVAIIFLPDLLDGEKQSYQEDFGNIPAEPNVNIQPQNRTFPSEKIDQLPKTVLSDEKALDDNENNVASTEDTRGAQVDTNASVKSEIKPKPSERSKSTAPEKVKLQEAWVIQLGSFRHKKNVDDLVKKLKKAGYSAFTEPIQTKNGTLTKVFVGPELVKSSLEKKIPALAELTKVQGKVARFNPTNK